MGVKREAYDYKNGNFDDLKDSLSRVPFEIAASADINEFWDNWKTLFSIRRKRSRTDQNSSQHELYRLNREIAKKWNFFKLAQNEVLRPLVTKNMLL